MDNKLLEEKLTALGETEMQMFRFMLDRPAGAILTVGTDKMLAQILAEDGLAEVDGDRVIIPAEIRDAYRNMWSDELTLKWQGCIRLSMTGSESTMQSNCSLRETWRTVKSLSSLRMKLK